MNSPTSPQAGARSGTSAGSNPAQDEQSFGQTARTALEDLKSGGRQAAQAVKSAATEMPDKQRKNAASQLHRASDMMHETARKAENEDPNIAWLTHSLADRIDRASDYLRDTDFQTLRSDTERFARQNPGLFFGGLLIVGVLAGSLLKASGSAMSQASSSSSGSSNGDDESGDMGIGEGGMGQDNLSAGATTEPDFPSSASSEVSP